MSYCQEGCDGNAHICYDCSEGAANSAASEERANIAEALFELSKDKESRNNFQRRIMWAIARDIASGRI